MLCLHLFVTHSGSSNFYHLWTCRSMSGATTFPQLSFFLSSPRVSIKLPTYVLANFKFARYTLTNLIFPHYVYLHTYFSHTFIRYLLWAGKLWEAWLQIRQMSRKILCLKEGGPFNEGPAGCQELAFGGESLRKGLGNENGITLNHSDLPKDISRIV